MSQELHQQEAHLRISNSILQRTIVFAPITTYPAKTYDAILAHNDDQSSGCSETEGDMYLYGALS